MHSVIFILLILLSGLSQAQENINCSENDISFSSGYPHQYTMEIEEFMCNHVDSIVLYEIAPLCRPISTRRRDRKKLTCIQISVMDHKPFYLADSNKVLYAKYFDSTSYDTNRLINPTKISLNEANEPLSSIFSYGHKAVYTMCYEPRHSIVFYKDAKISGMVEVCFACYEAMAYFKLIGVKLLNEETINQLKKFFQKQGYIINSG